MNFAEHVKYIMPDRWVRIFANLVNDVKISLVLKRYWTHQDLTKSKCWHSLVYISRRIGKHDASTTPLRSQTADLATPRDAQPSSRGCDRFTVYRARILRSARLASGEVRNAPPSGDGWRIGDRGGEGLWFVEANLLPGTIGFSQRWINGVAAQKERTSRGSQAQQRNRILPRGRVSRRQFVGRSSLGSTCQGTLWDQGPSTKRRACFAAAGKKTALIQESHFRGEATAPTSVVDAYETLRRHTLHSGVLADRFGLAILIQKGMCAWAEAYISCRPPAAGRRPP